MIAGKGGDDRLPLKAYPDGTNLAGILAVSGPVGVGNATDGGFVNPFPVGFVKESDGTLIFPVTDDNGYTKVYLATKLDSTNDSITAYRGAKATYSSAVAGLVPVATATDIVEIIGSASKTVRIAKISISGVATAAGSYNVQLIKRSAAATGGTSSSLTKVPNDSGNVASGATVKAYTANPTVGAIIAAVRSQRMTVSTSAAAITIVPCQFDLATSESQGIVLRGAAETLCINLNGVTMTGGLLDIYVEWTEE